MPNLMTDHEWELLAKYVSGNAVEQERQSVENWITQSEENQALLLTFTRYWREAHRLPTHFTQFKGEDWARLTAARSHSAVRRPRFYESMPFRVAASFFLLCSIATVIFLLSSRHDSSASTIIAGDVIKEVWLPDSTLVVMNKQSTLTLADNFGKENRRMTMQGEVFFEVKPDASLPFQIVSFDVTTTVLGTSFNVKSIESTQASVSVLHGKVKVEARDREVILTGGEHVVYDSIVGLHQSKSADLNFLSWKTGILRFEDQSLPMVIRELSEYYGESIKIGRNVSGALTITVEINKQTLPEALNMIALTLDLKVVKTSDGYLLSGIE
jgi:transmembrane sensor